MKIDKNKLVDLLVDKTSMEKSEVEAQLDQLIERIIDASKRGKALEIKDFGLFYFDENQELKFDPAKELSTEISFKYAGMKPVELRPERDSGIAFHDEEIFDDDDEDEPEDDIFGIDDIDEEEEAFEPKSQYLEEEEETAGIFDEEDDDMDDFDFLSDLATEPAEPSDSAGTRKETETKEKFAASKLKLNRQPVRKKNNVGIWVFAVILIIVIALGLYYYFTEMQEFSQQTGRQQDQITQTDPEPEASPENVSSIEDELPGQTSPEITGPDEPEEQELFNEVTIAAEPVEVVPPNEQPLYGLTGIVNEQANDGYSIVLHSFNDEINARQTAERLGNDGFRALVSSRSVASNTMWRVSVGQFETLTDAQDAVSRLPNPYNTQNFIHRIQIN